MNAWDVFTITEAAELMEINISTLKRHVVGGPTSAPLFWKSEARKSGGTWIVTRKGLDRVYENKHGGLDAIPEERADIIGIAKAEGELCRKKLGAEIADKYSRELFELIEKKMNGENLTSEIIKLFSRISQEAGIKMFTLNWYGMNKQFEIMASAFNNGLSGI